VDQSDPDLIVKLGDLVTKGIVTSASTALELRALDPRLATSSTMSVIDAWRSGAAVATGVIVVGLQSASFAKTLQAARATTVEVVGTGPVESGSSLRATAQVASEMVSHATRYVLVVGYSINFDLLGRGATGQLLENLKAAATRGVHIRLILHDDPRNKEMFLRAWKGFDQKPQILTWVGHDTDAMLKLHAKLLVADDTDMLVTSANLTYHGLERNIELGVRLKGPEAMTVRMHFDNLQRHGHLVSWSASPA
jgi:phosphatidylserine/phosphatidylglycerophosphate/cardiolipin synthase-like enzyme